MDKVHAADIGEYAAKTNGRRSAGVPVRVRFDGAASFMANCPDDCVEVVLGAGLTDGEVDAVVRYTRRRGGIKVAFGDGDRADPCACCVTAVCAPISECLFLPTAHGVRRVNVENIRYIESFGHKMSVDTCDGVFVVTASMRELQQRLEKYGFYRVSKSYLVNLGHVESAEGNSIRVGAALIDLRRGNKRVFMRRLSERCRVYR